MSATVRWEGLDELRAALRALPETLTVEASRIIEGIANGAVVDMRAEYPAGELRDKLTQAEMAHGRFGYGIQIKNASGWAWHWDHGTAERHWKGGKPTGKEWGGKDKHPPHTFGRTMAQDRRRMYDRLKELLVLNGLGVSGDA